MSESKIQTRIKYNLEKNGWLVIKLIQTSFNGIPDLLCIKGGRTVFIEVKDIGKFPSLLQSIRHSQLQKYGAEVHFTSDKNFTL